MMKNKILIVEDSSINRSILNRILADEYDIIEASDGVEAIDIIEKRYQEIAAVILDLLMPKMGGLELLKIISAKEKYNQMPVMIATGEHDDELESECLKSGAWDFITKPYNPIVLKSRLHNIIGLSQTQLMYRIRIMAERDLLTNLYNRRFFMKTTSEMLHKNIGTTYVLIRMDIDQFRLYNSSFGSTAGDTLLMKIANGISNHMNKKENVTYGRIESDVFCICIPYDQKGIENNLKSARENVQKLCDNYHLKLSFGLYVIDDHHMDMEKIYANAAEAARACKKDKNISYAYYSDEMGQQEIKAQMFSNEINRAIEEKQFQVYLQPKYSIITDMPCGAEALVRWIHPEWGMVSPGEFILIFE